MSTATATAPKLGPHGIGSLFPKEIAEHRPAMIRYARLLLRDDVKAEDVVQDSLVSALEAWKSFEQKSSYKTWLFSILRNKVLDLLRREKRNPVMADFDDEIPEQAFDFLFDQDGNCLEDENAAGWGSPEQSYEDKQFWMVLELCLNRLPDNTARVFIMREHLGFETDEICKELGISGSNCGVILYRARMNLRLCLQEQWFDSVGAKKK